ncbi:hypothetical protein [Kitasatospora purpeofusca]|uniref:hypothetical protein n=1 Tax=Kitasatospora purpeofusca TaxID=67352 RepID=UPI0037FF297C
MATRATRQKEAIIGERAPERIKRAEHKGAIGAYAYTASRYLRDSHGLEEAEAARVWKDHIKQWRKATDEDEERDKAL